METNKSKAKSGEGKSCESCKEVALSDECLHCMDFDIINRTFMVNYKRWQPKTKESGEIPQVTARVDDFGFLIICVGEKEISVGLPLIKQAIEISRRINTDVEKVIVELKEKYKDRYFGHNDTRLDLLAEIRKRLSSEGK